MKNFLGLIWALGTAAGAFAACGDGGEGALVDGTTDAGGGVGGEGISSAGGGGSGGGAAGTGGAAADIVSRCEQVVEASCDALAGCCEQGFTFDAFECRRLQLDACFMLVGLDESGAGPAAIDEAALSTCVKPVEDCPSLQNGYFDPYSYQVDPNDAEQVAACARIQGGVRPPGSACYDSGQCAAGGSEGFPECMYGNGYDGGGVCVQSVFSTDDTCGFDPETLVQRRCAPDSYCYAPSRTVPIYGSSQGASAFAFEGRCVPPRLEGEVCVDPATGTEFPCADGLLCSYWGPEPICQRLRDEGESCMDRSTGMELPCADGLLCSYDPVSGIPVCARALGPGEACASSAVPCGAGMYCDYALDECVADPYYYGGTAGGAYCYTDTPATCGDGTCSRPYEDEYVCAIDCQICGDFYCSGDEYVTCPVDCVGYCGDYSCSPGEEYGCPQDCGYYYYCGDGYCDFDEASFCPEDCGSACLDASTCAQLTRTPSCPSGAQCTCDSCGCEVLDCTSTPGCLEIVGCLERIGCPDLASCYGPQYCQDVIDAHGGPFGAAGTYADYLNWCSTYNWGCQACFASMGTEPDGGAQPQDAGAPAPGDGG